MGCPSLAPSSHVTMFQAYSISLLSCIVLRSIYSCNYKPLPGSVPVYGLCRSTYVYQDLPKAAGLWLCRRDGRRRPIRGCDVGSSRAKMGGEFGASPRVGRCRCAFRRGKLDGHTNHFKSNSPLFPATACRSELGCRQHRLHAFVQRGTV